jgi:hypothetical protein
VPGNPLLWQDRREFTCAGDYGRYFGGTLLPELRKLPAGSAGDAAGLRPHRSPPQRSSRGPGLIPLPSRPPSARPRGKGVAGVELPDTDLPPFEFPAELADAGTVGLIYDEIDGLNF